MSGESLRNIGSLREGERETEREREREKERKRESASERERERSGYQADIVKRLKGE